MTANDRQQPAVTDTDGTPLRAGPMPYSLPMSDGGRHRASPAGNGDIPHFLVTIENLFGLMGQRSIVTGK